MFVSLRWENKNPNCWAQSFADAAMGGRRMPKRWLLGGRELIRDLYVYTRICGKPLLLSHVPITSWTDGETRTDALENICHLYLNEKCPLFDSIFHFSSWHPFFNWITRLSVRLFSSFSRSLSSDGLNDVKFMTFGGHTKIFIFIRCLLLESRGEKLCFKLTFLDYILKRISTAVKNITINFVEQTCEGE